MVVQVQGARRTSSQMDRTLSTFQFDIQHQPGRLHGNSDGLSRIPCEDICKKCNPVSHKRRGEQERKEEEEEQIERIPTNEE